MILIMHTVKILCYVWHCELQKSVGLVVQVVKDSNNPYNPPTTQYPKICMVGCTEGGFKNTESLKYKEFTNI